VSGSDVLPAERLSSEQQPAAPATHSNERAGQDDGHTNAAFKQAIDMLRYAAGSTASATVVAASAGARTSATPQRAAVLCASHAAGGGAPSVDTGSAVQQSGHGTHMMDVGAPYHGEHFHVQPHVATSLRSAPRLPSTRVVSQRTLQPSAPTPQRPVAATRNCSTLTKCTTKPSARVADAAVRGRAAARALGLDVPDPTKKQLAVCAKFCRETITHGIGPQFRRKRPRVETAEAVGPLSKRPPVRRGAYVPGRCSTSVVCCLHSCGCPCSTVSMQSIWRRLLLVASCHMLLLVRTLCGPLDTCMYGPNTFSLLHVTGVASQRMMREAGLDVEVPERGVEDGNCLVVPFTRTLKGQPLQLPCACTRGGQCSVVYAGGVGAVITEQDMATAARLLGFAPNAVPEDNVKS